MYKTLSPGALGIRGLSLGEKHPVGEGHGF